MKSKPNLVIAAVLLLVGMMHPQQKQINPTPDSQKAAWEDSQLKVVHRVPPIYPPEAKAKGMEGTVVLEVVVDKQGNVAKARIISGAQIFADAALEAIKAWKFAPATSQGQAVEKTTQIKSEFL